MDKHPNADRLAAVFNKALGPSRVYIVVCLDNPERSFFRGHPSPVLCRTREDAEREKVSANLHCCSSRHAVWRLDVRRSW